MSTTGSPVVLRDCDPRAKRSAGSAIVALVVLGLAASCGQAPGGGQPESDVSAALARSTLRRVAVLPFRSRAAVADDPDHIAADMAASMLGAALQERRGMEFKTATIDPGDARMREFYDEWGTDHTFADPAFVRQIASADSADAVLVGIVQRWEQKRTDDGYETRVDLMAGLFNGHTGEWIWYGRDADVKTAADAPVDFSQLMRGLTAALAATLPAAGG